MSDNLLKDKINEISLLLVMTSEGDQAGISMLAELCESMSELSSGSAHHQRLTDAWKYIKEKSTTCSQAERFKLIQDYINAALALTENASNAKFPNEEQKNVNGDTEINNFDSGDNVDRAFLAEYIETHKLQLEEMESSLLDFEFNTGDKKGIEEGVKRYLHSLKGDSGSIGLHSIEHLCHEVENIISEVEVSSIAGQLLLLKEWLVDCFTNYSNGTKPQSSAEDFLKRFKASCALVVGTPTNKPTQTISNSKQNSHTQDLGEYLVTGEKEILVEFSNEAEEHLNNVEGIIIDSEGNYTKDSIDTIFRGVHSIKGGSAYFNLEEMTKTSHILENILDEVRSGKRQLDQTLSSFVLTYIDLQRNLLNTSKEAIKSDSKIKRSPSAKKFLIEIEDYQKGKVSTSQTANDVEHNNEEQGSDDKSARGEKVNIKNFVKVDTTRLDHLVDSIGEMVIYSSMLIRHCRQLLSNNEEAMEATRRVEKFGRDLQDVGMSMRLVPIKGLFQKMSRLVWDTAKKIGKDVTFSMDGEDTELDRNLIDKLSDPLMHMVRNSLDHGIEPSDERSALGKPRSGKVHLSATYSGGSVLIRIQDDGRGLNPDKLIAKAIEKGIIHADQKLSEQEAFQLIFAAGFSTAAKVTDISGRGVGMDVVRRNVESLRGRIIIDSKVGQGSVFTIELPLTLAIIDGIEVAVGDETFIIPSLSIVEFVRPTEQMLSYILDQGETFHFRNKYLPIFRLADLFNMKPKYSKLVDSTFIVVENHNEQFVIMVDEILGEYSAVIKSLGPVLDQVKGVSGCAIMPSGDVSLILDIRSLANMGRATGKKQNLSNHQELITNA